MSTDIQFPDADIDWDSFYAKLEEYVRLELSGDLAAMRHPDIALLVETVPACEEAYYREFRRQGLQLSADELRAHSLNPAWSALDFLPASADEGAIDESAPDLHKVLIEHGWAWVEQLSGRWRELRLTLQNLTFSSDSPPVLKGMMAEIAPVEEVSPETFESYAQLSVEPEDADFDLRVLVSRGAAQDDALCSIRVIVTLHDRFGDYSGVDIHLRFDERDVTAFTNAEGVARFADIPCRVLPHASLIIRLPD